MTFFPHTLTLFLLCCIISLQTNGQSTSHSLKFQRVSFEKNTLKEHMRDIIQDNEGFIWLATPSGLYRYDGLSFQSFKHNPEDTLSLPSNDISKLFLDSQGRLWVVTRKGICCFEKASGRFYRQRFSCLKAFQFISGGYLTLGPYDNFWFWSEKEDNMIRFNIWTQRCEWQAFDSTNIFPLFGKYFRQEIISEHDGKKWIINPQRYLQRIGDTTSSKKHDVSELTDLILSKTPYDMFEDVNENLWLSLPGGGIVTIHPYTKEFEYFRNDELKAFGIPSYDKLYFIGQAAPHKIWIKISHDDFSEQLGYLDLQNKKFCTFSHDPLDPNSIGKGKISSSLIDREGNLWIGTTTGLNRAYIRENHISAYRYNPTSQEGLHSPFPKPVMEDALGNIWVINPQAPINILNPKTDEIRSLNFSIDGNQSLEQVDIKGMIYDPNGFIWLGTEDKLVRFDPKTQGVNSFEFPREGLSNISVYKMKRKSVGIEPVLIDKTGKIWIITAEGLIIFDPLEETFVDWSRNHPSFKFNHQIDDLHQDKSGMLWFSLNTFSLNESIPNDSHWALYEVDPVNRNPIAHPLSIGQHEFISLRTITDSLFWFMTSQEGLLTWNLKAKTIKRNEEITGKDRITGIVSDQKNNLWISTMNGLITYDPGTNTKKRFDKNDGLLSDEIRQGFCSTSSGKLFFSNANGVISFHPDSLSGNPFSPPVYVTKLRFFDRSDNKGHITEIENITYQDVINLSYNQNLISLSFAALSYTKSPRNQYAYRLSEKENDMNVNWNNLGTLNTLNFPTLKPGTYYLSIKGTNGDGVWSEKAKTLKITLRPPWWLSFPAKIFYGLLFLALIVGIYRFMLNRKLAHAETVRLMELDQVKTKLYTNITHEFRTPLTVILGMANKIFQDPDKWSKNGSDIILRNSNQLLRLINQMLDLAKLESGKIQLNEIQADIIPYICYLVESFHSYAESKKVNLHLLPQVEYLIMDYDHKRVREIISNLLSNAIKFTPEAGNVYVSILADEKHLILKIKDTGIGIPEAKLPHIFDRFYQTDDSSTRTGEGTGIGLALTQEMTNLMGGSIFVKSDVDKGSEFTVQLPIKNMANKSDHFPTEGHRAHTYIDSAPHFETALFAPNDDQNLPLVLIVEDNVDVVTYLLSCLEGDYRTEIAFDGKEGIEKAIALGPDIIISDVMMPKKDGFEVCDVLKNDMQTNHIPIILLTAKADIDSRLVGIKTGADVYLAKPFHEEELQFQIIRLLELRSELQKKYSDPNYLTGKMKFQAKTTVSRQEDLFITKIRDFVLANLSDENLDVDRICKEIGLSRTSLHNKLKALTNKSTTEFIRFIRINKAADLLAQNRDKHVAEIANETGFVSPSYFAKVFKELFGVNPTEYKNRY